MIWLVAQLPPPNPDEVSGPDAFLVLGLIALFWLTTCILGAKLRARTARAHSSPKAILRRCRRGLKLVRRELERIPATREVHETLADIDRTLRSIDEKELQLK